jgi:hypothetical protein
VAFTREGRFLIDARAAVLAWRVTAVFIEAKGRTFTKALAVCLVAEMG